MSFEAVLWATSDAPIASVNEFAVLTMLAEKADPDGCNAFPSRPTIAARTKVDPKTVLRCFQALEARGLIAEGDQRAAEYIRADRRPVVYDLLIPYSWFPNIDRINKERQERGRPPLTRSTRPDIAPAPAKKQRSDKGKPRAKKQAADQQESSRGDSKSPRDEDGYGVTLSPPRGDSQSATGGLQVTQPCSVTQSTTRTDSVPPSVCDVQVPDAIGSDGDRGTDGGGGVIEDQEHGPVAASGESAAAGAAPGNDGSNEGGGAAPGPVSVVRPVDLTPGVEVLRAIAAEAPQWSITHAETLRDQGLIVTGMLASGFTAQEIRHALLARPLPQPLRTTVGAIVARRLRDLLAVGPAAGVRPIPAQQTGEYDPVRQEPEDQDETPVPASWADQRAQLEAEVSGVGRHRPCAGDEGMCPRLALPGMDLCSVCLGGEQPTCAAGCGRGVIAHTMRCITCAEPEDPGVGVCPGHGGKPCRRAVVTEGLCRRCKFEAEEARLAAEAEWAAARDAAVTAAQAAEPTPAPF
ncbi:helix-turn-helix domain-containing protein [Streptomyces sp. NPDC057271]|uniref:helix-turn-helix domain-containing protein n=1 Tax=unclassified Streptomyces TaxID=2593676 RepID=UPI003638BB47